MKREFGHKIIDRLYNSGNLTLNECAEKRFELSRLNEDQIEDFIKGLKNAKSFLLEFSDQPKEDEDDQTKEYEDDEEYLFYAKLILSIVLPPLLFFFSFDLVSDASNGFSGWGNRSKPIDFKATWWVWAICIFSILYIEKRLYKSRENFGCFNKPLLKPFFYLSIILTAVANIYFFLSLMVQFGDVEASMIGKSTKDGFIFDVFCYTYLAPLISWLIYYLTLKKIDALIEFINSTKKRRKEKIQGLKRREAVKQLKEAKELLDLGILSKSEYDKQAEELKPIILDN